MLIDEIARAAGLEPDDYEPYGRDKAKLAIGLAERLEDRARGRPPARYIGVTAINPTPLGEGKTVTAIGLAMALCRRGHRAICTLREPSLGPLFGIKGGGAGGGRATLEPADDINLHFTGDIHAVATATNLLAALVDNHVRRGLEPQIDPASIRTRRALDLCDRGLERITTGLAFTDPAAHRETGFDLAPAAEMMAILALAADLPDLRRRLGRVVVGERADSSHGEPPHAATGNSLSYPGQLVTADDLGFAGSLAVLMRDALRPNLVRTCEGTPALVHAGPFANIAHGNCSVIADRCAAQLGDFVVTESGFGADCGAEKLFHIKCRATGLWPAAMVLVCTARALKFHSGRFVVRPGKPLPVELGAEDVAAVEAGAANLQAHLELLGKFRVPVVVAINRFPGDHPSELARIAELSRRFGAREVAVSDAFASGGLGTLDLAAAVERAADSPLGRDVAGGTTSEPGYLYRLDMSLEEKLSTIACEVYGADGVDLSEAAARQAQQLVFQGYGKLPVCVAKTQYSLSHDPTLLGRPRGFRVPIHELRLSAGAGYVYALAGEIRTMPGLPSRPAALRIDLDAAGRPVGLR